MVVPKKPSSSNATPSQRQEIVAVATADASNIVLLAQRSLDIWNECSNSKNQQQVYIACVGSPGSGKSTLCDKVVQAINERKGCDNFSVVIPMDGYHIPKSELITMGALGVLIGDRESTVGETTTYADLMKRRGAPWTFDPARLHDDLTAARASGAGCFPLYDRSIGDPVPHQISVTRDHKIIFCEGNYLLALDDPHWAPLGVHWDDQWLIDVPERVLKERLVQRHLKNWNSSKVQLFGEGRKGAERKIESSDLKNAHWIHQRSRAYANLIITYD